MLEAIACLSSGTLIEDRGLLIITKNIDLSLVRAGEVPILDSHRNRRLGHVTDAWIADSMGLMPQGPLMGKLQFDDNEAGWRAHGMVEREEITGVSVGITFTGLGISEPDGTPLDVEAALERRDDPDLIIVAKRSLLTEVSLTSMPGDRNARVWATGEDVLIRQMIRDGEAKLKRILHPDEHDWRSECDGDPDAMFRRILAGRRIVHHGAAEPMHLTDDDGYHRAFSPELMRYR